MKRLVSVIAMLAMLTSALPAHAYYNTSEMLSMNVNSEITGNIRYRIERDMYKVRPTGYGPVEIELEYLETVNQVCWRVVVITGGSYQVFNEKNSPSDPVINGKKVHKMKTVRTSSELHVIVTAHDNLNTSDYTLKIRQTHESYSDTEIEFSNNTVNFCGRISKGTTYKGNLYNKWDLDYFNFTLTEASPVKLNFTPPEAGGDFVAEIYDDRLNIISSAVFNSSSELTVDTLQPGSYFLKIAAGENYSNNDYKFNIN